MPSSGDTMCSSLDVVVVARCPKAEADTLASFLRTPCGSYCRPARGPFELLYVACDWLAEELRVGRSTSAYIEGRLAHRIRSPISTALHMMLLITLGKKVAGSIGLLFTITNIFTVRTMVIDVATRPMEKMMQRPTEDAKQNSAVSDRQHCPRGRLSGRQLRPPGVGLLRFFRSACSRKTVVTGAASMTKSVMMLKMAFPRWIWGTPTLHTAPGIVLSHAAAIGLHPKIPACRNSIRGHRLYPRSRTQTLTNVVAVTKQTTTAASAIKIGRYGLRGKKRE